jgi:hypothetical protein
MIMTPRVARVAMPFAAAFLLLGATKCVDEGRPAPGAATTSTTTTESASFTSANAGGAGQGGASTSAPDGASHDGDAG